MTKSGACRSIDHRNLQAGTTIHNPTEYTCGGKVAETARIELENRLGHSVISSTKASDHLLNNLDDLRKLE